MSDLQHPISYMKGKGKHWFWAIPVLLIFLVVAQSSLGQTKLIWWDEIGLYMATVITIWVFYGGGMATALVMFGRACTVKTYRRLFLFLAYVQVLSVLSGILYDWQSLYAPRSYCTITDTIEIQIMLAVRRFVIPGLNTLIASTLVVCLFVIGCGKPANITIRVSSILLALFIAFVYLSTLFNGSYLFMLSYFLFTAGIPCSVLALFFFSTIAFTRPRVAFN